MFAIVDAYRNGLLAIKDWPKNIWNQFLANRHRLK